MEDISGESLSEPKERDTGKEGLECVVDYPPLEIFQNGLTNPSQEWGSTADSSQGTRRDYMTSYFPTVAIWTLQYSWKVLKRSAQSIFLPLKDQSRWARFSFFSVKYGF